MDGWSSYEKWGSRVAPSTAKTNGKVFTLWMKWVEEGGSRFADYTPDMLVEYQRTTDNGSAYDILDEIVQPYIIQKSGTHGYLNKILSTIKSFFMHNRAALPKDPSFKVRADKENVKGTLTVEEVKHLVLSCSPLYQAVYMCLFQAGLDQASLIYWNRNGWPSVEEALKGNPRTIRIDIPGRKGTRFNKDFYTFIGENAIQKLRTYVDNYRPRDAKTIFVNQHGDELTKNGLYLYWNRHLRKLGLTEKGTDSSKRSGKNPHEMRDVMRSRWRISGVDVEVGEFFMGHALDLSGYDKSPEHYPEWFEEQYNEVQPWLNILTDDPQKVPRREITALQQRIRELEARPRETEMELRNMVLALLNDPDLAAQVKKRLEK